MIELAAKELQEAMVSLVGQRSPLANPHLSAAVRCDKTNVDDGDDNYSPFTPTRTFVVGNRSAVRTETRAVGSG